jgi:hypothetical protein
MSTAVMETQRIAMWSGPRNISTAMMRSFENRPDCTVVDEPFYAAYLAATDYQHPGQAEILASQPQDWRVVADALCHDKPAALYYQKHMTQHILPQMDLGFTAHFSNCFLIREPRRIIASYAKVRPRFALEELGFPQQLALFERECDRLGHAPPVLDAAVTLADPRGVLSALCRELEISFDERMLSWPAGPRDTDGVWAPHWYASVWASTGFASPESQGESTGKPVQPVQPVYPVQAQLCEEAERIYQKMLPYILRG